MRERERERREKKSKRTGERESEKRENVRESMSHELVSQVFHPERQTFVMPVPGMNGAKAGSLKGKTFVLTGVFPEVGGGQGLNLGKDKVETMITSFGGTVTSAISGMYAHDKHLLAGLR